MEFEDSKPIYLQIAYLICDKILAGDIQPGERILSVREYGAEIGVNPNTIARSYEKLTDMGVIYNKRGIGYFVCDDAKEVVLGNARAVFLNEELPQIIKKMKLLGLKGEELPDSSEQCNKGVRL